MRVALKTIIDYRQLSHSSVKRDPPGVLMSFAGVLCSLSASSTCGNVHRVPVCVCKKCYGICPRLDKQIFIFQTPRGAPAKPIGAAKDKSPQKPAPYLHKKKVLCSCMLFAFEWPQHSDNSFKVVWGRARGRSFTNPRPLGLGLNCYPVLCVCVLASHSFS